jgi:hypothetical protein
MARLLTLLMILAVVTTQGMAMASALCRHDSAQEHVLARQSTDARIASISIGEESAARSLDDKASGSADSSAAWPAKMLPADSAAQPLRIAERSPLRPSRQHSLPSLSVLPLLEPPAA